MAVADVSGGPARRLVRASSPVWLDDHMLAVLVEQELSRLPAADPAPPRFDVLPRWPLEAVSLS